MDLFSIFCAIWAKSYVKNYTFYKSFHWKLENKNQFWKIISSFLDDSDFLDISIIISFRDTCVSFIEFFSYSNIWPESTSSWNSRPWINLHFLELLWKKMPKNNKNFIVNKKEFNWNFPEIFPRFKISFMGLKKRWNFHIYRFYSTFISS